MWWVRPVDQPTTQRNLEEAVQPSHGVSLLREVGREKYLEMTEEGLRNVREGIEKNQPGRTLADVALHYALSTYFTHGLYLDGKGKRHGGQIAEGLRQYVPTPKDLGVERWKGTEEEASNTVEQAGIHCGAAQVAFTTVEPKWLYAGVTIDPDIDEIETRDRQVFVPERFKYVIVCTIQVPPVLAKRAPSELGNAADRSGWARAEMVQVMLTNFITALGYEVQSLPGPYPPFAVMAGLGEMGRMNRMVSPLFGGNVRLAALLTDLPVALDKPVDFGLQEFCVRCKKCATVCPVEALSFDDEPTWQPQGSWSAPGKKVYFENSVKCRSYLSSEATFCTACMVACPWSKQNGTALHTISRIMGSQLPVASGLMVRMDDAFGYGLTPPTMEQEEWWNYNLPSWGVDTMQGNR